MNNIETKKPFSVLIPDGESNYAISVLRCLAQTKNVRSYILSNDPWAPIRFSRYSTHFFSYKNEQGSEGRLAAIRDAIKKTNVDVVLPVDVETIRLLSSGCEALSQLTSITSLPKTHLIDIAEDKWLLAKWLNKNQIPHPPTLLYETNDSFDEALSALTFPVLIKPRKGSGGKGINFFDNPSALYIFCKEHISSGEFIVQSFINGYDIDCSVLCREGEILAYTIQKGIMYDTQHISWPAGLDFLYDESTYNVVREMVGKFSWSGIVHIDLRYDEQEKQIKVIEMNPRFWASVSASIFAGVNFPYLACLNGLKRDLPQVIIQPKRVLRSGPAIRSLVQRFVNGKQGDVSFDNSFIEFILRDPLPTMVGKYSKIYSRIFNKRQKTLTRYM